MWCCCGVLWWVVAVTILLLLLHVYCKRIGFGRYCITEDLTGKVVIVTGASAGIGKETARQLARHGASVYMACRNLDKAENAAKEMREQGCKGKLVVMLLELTSLDSVRKFAQEFLARENRLDILVNNAGIGAQRRSSPALTEDGIEEIMQTNHFGHFLLTGLLLDLLKRTVNSRIVSVSSMLHAWAHFDADKPPSFQSTAYSALNAYNCSKLCNVLFTRSLARRLYGSGTTANCLHPGVVVTELGRDIPGAKWLQPYVGNALSKLFLKTSLEGAQTSLYCALAPELQHVSGAYFSDCKPKQMSLKALDDELAEKLWMISEKLTKL